MINATRITASAFGIYAGLLAIQHGIYETQQGSVDPGGVLFNAKGPPCEPELVWHACYPAMTVIPNLLITGIVTILLGLGLVVWATGFVRRRFAGRILLVFAISLLLVGGGFVPAIFGTLAGVAASRIDRAPAWLEARSEKVVDILRRFWPWALISLFIWVLGSSILGHFLGQVMLQLEGFLFMIFDFLLPLFILLTAFAHDFVQIATVVPGES